MAVIAGSVLDLLPDVGDVMPDVPSGWIMGYATFNSFLPLAEGLAFATIMLTAYAGLGLWKLAVTIYHLIPKPLMGT